MSWLDYFILWLKFGVCGTVVLYIGYGFYCGAKTAINAVEPKPKSQRIVALIDTYIVLAFTLLDAALNLIFYSVVMFDFWPSSMFKRTSWKGHPVWLPNLVTGRMEGYARNTDERNFRRWTAALFEAFLGPKDPRGYHIASVTRRFPWLD